MMASKDDVAALADTLQKLVASVDAMRAQRDDFERQTRESLKAMEEAIGSVSVKLDGIAMQQSRDRTELRNEHNRVLAALSQLESVYATASGSGRLGESRRSLEDLSLDMTSPRVPKPKGVLRRQFDFKGHMNAVVGVAYSSDGVLVGTASADKVARIWNAVTGALVQTLIGHSDYVRAICFNPDASLVATGSSDNRVFIWTTQDGNHVASITLAVDACAVNFSPNGAQLVVGSGETVSLWDTKTYKRVSTMPGMTSRNVYAAVFSPSGALVAGGTDTMATIWDVASGAERMRVKGHSSIVVDVNFSPDETRIATASWDKTARLWSLNTGECLTILSGHTSWVNAVSWCRDGSVLCTASSDCTVAVWDATGKRLCVTSLAKPCTAAAFSPTDEVLVVGCKDSVVIEYRWA